MGEISAKGESILGDYVENQVLCTQTLVFHLKIISRFCTVFMKINLNIFTVTLWL